jgi:hypothetical protein
MCCQVPFQSYLTDQFSVAYDIYLELHRRVQLRITTALQRPTNWNQENICPPCFYKLGNEPPLTFSALLAMDGNNSLKLIDSFFRPGQKRIDSRTVQWSKWITPEEVDVYKDEISNIKSKVGFVFRCNPL